MRTEEEIRKELEKAIAHYDTIDEKGISASISRTALANYTGALEFVLGEKASMMDQLNSEDD